MSAVASYRRQAVVSLTQWADNDGDPDALKGALHWIQAAEELKALVSNATMRRESRDEQEGGAL